MSDFLVVLTSAMMIGVAQPEGRYRDVVVHTVCTRPNEPYPTVTCEADIPAFVAGDDLATHERMRCALLVTPFGLPPNGTIDLVHRPSYAKTWQDGKLVGVDRPRRQERDITVNIPYYDGGRTVVTYVLHPDELTGACVPLPPPMDFSGYLRDDNPSMSEPHDFTVNRAALEKTEVLPGVE